MSGVVCKMKHESDSCLINEGRPQQNWSRVQQNAGNPTDSLETQSINVLYGYSVSTSWWVDRGKIKESYLLFYKCGGAGGLPPPPPHTHTASPLPPPMWYHNDVRFIVRESVVVFLIWIYEFTSVQKTWYFSLFRKLVLRFGYCFMVSWLFCFTSSCFWHVFTSMMSRIYPLPVLLNFWLFFLLFVFFFFFQFSKHFKRIQ